MAEVWSNVFKTNRLKEAEQGDEGGHHGKGSVDPAAEEEKKGVKVAILAMAPLYLACTG